MQYIVTWLMSAYVGFGACATVLSIGKPRQPVTPGLALAALVVSALMFAGVFYLGAN